MKILFLDIDGVLNSVRTSMAFGGYPMELTHLEAFDQVAIKLLQRLCDSAGIQIVLSSAWRLHFPFKNVGQALELPIIDRTAYLGTTRGVEINDWLVRHPEVETWAIIDDDNDMLPDQQTRFVRTDGFEGMSWKDFSKLCEILGASPYEGQPRNRDWFKKPGKPNYDFPEVQPWTK